MYHSLEEGLFRHSPVHWDHFMSDINRYICRRWVVLVAARLLPSCRSLLIETAAVWSWRTVTVLGFFIGRHGVVETCPHSTPHLVNIRNVVQNGPPVEILETVTLVLSQSSHSTPTESLFLG